MPRQFKIVGIGEAVIRESGAASEPGGLALEVALWAARFGHRGIPVSRLGQDDRASEILSALAEQQINCSHLQSDPDLPTGRLVLRSIAGTTRHSLDSRAAFDNLQWDFDLVDVARRADAVVFGLRAARGGQTGSVIRRFLAECGSAVRLVDQTNRDDEIPDSHLVRRSAALADIAICDHAALNVLRRPGRALEESAIDTDVVAEILRDHNLLLLVRIGADRTVRLYSETSQATAAADASNAPPGALATAMLHGVLHGAGPQACASLLEHAVKWATDHPREQVPQHVLTLAQEG